MVRWGCHFVLCNFLHNNHCYSSIGSQWRICIRVGIPAHSQGSWKRILELRIYKLVFWWNLCMIVSFITWSSSGSVWSGCWQEHVSHFHRIFLSMVSPQNSHPASQWNHLVFLGNLYPWWGRRFRCRFHLAEIWDKGSLLIQGMDLGVRVTLGCYGNLKIFPHILWITHRYCIQFEIPFHYPCHLSGIWNVLN